MQADLDVDVIFISIHVLREEDDPTMAADMSKVKVFLSTSSARRTTVNSMVWAKSGKAFLSTSSARRTTCDFAETYGILDYISIHVLREEDDRIARIQVDHRAHISIHVLREEDDSVYRQEPSTADKFLSTSSARRTTGMIGSIFAPKSFLSTSSARRTTIASFL